MTGYICSDCDSLFTYRNGLRRHMKRAHDEKERSCPRCGAGFSKWEPWKRYIRRFHGQDRKSPPPSPATQERIWTQVAMKPGTLVPWVDGTKLMIVSPTTIAGYQVPRWWTQAQAMRAFGLTEADLVRMEQAADDALQEQAAQAAAARAQTRTPFSS